MGTGIELGEGPLNPLCSGENIMKTEIDIDGMTCQNCVKHATKALQDLDQVTSVVVTLEQKKAVIESNASLEDHVISAAIEDAGYTATEIRHL